MRRRSWRLTSWRLTENMVNVISVALIRNISGESVLRQQSAIFDGSVQTYAGQWFCSVSATLLVHHSVPCIGIVSSALVFLAVNSPMAKQLSLDDATVNTGCNRARYNRILPITENLPSHTVLPIQITENFAIG
jgi:hypothetical protein